MKVMTFNLQSWNYSDERDNSVKEIIERYLPEVVGFQEVTPRWEEFLKKNFSNRYNFFGKGRYLDDNHPSGEEKNTIMVKKEGYKVYKTDTFWLTDTPKVPSKAESSALNRIVTTALVEEKETGDMFIIFNTHLDYIEDIARTYQALCLLTFIKTLKNVGIILTGDFNASDKEPAYEQITCYLNDSRFDTTDCKLVETYHSNGQYKPVTIDYIFHNGLIRVNEYKVITDEIDGVLPSDHYPVMIDCYVK